MAIRRWKSLILNLKMKLEDAKEYISADVEIIEWWLECLRKEVDAP